VKIKAVTIGALCAFFLAGCATTPTTSSASLAACKGLVATTQAMTTIKPKLPVQTQQQIGEALHTAAGYCLTPNPPANANAAVAGILNSLNALALQIAQQKASTAPTTSSTGATK
jgi:outer membrane lipoprotein SlyB